MSITSFNETGDGERGDSTENGVVLYHSWQVETNSASDRAITILSYSGCPKYGDPYSAAFPTFLCTRVSCRRLNRAGGRTTWEVTATYEDKITDADGTKLEIQYAARKINRAVKDSYDLPIDINGWPYFDVDTYPTRNTRDIPLVNSVGDPFDTPYTQELSNVIIYIRRNEFNITPYQVLQYRDTINLEDIVVADLRITALYGKMNSINLEPKIDSENNMYWRVEYEIEVSLDQPWIASILNQGHRYLGADTELHKVVDETGQETEAPKALSATGSQLDVTSNNPVYLNFYTWYPWPWDALGLPTTIAPQVLA